MSKTYVYSPLKDASGSVNVIAIVKFHRKPEKTKGSSFSLFVSITDPSLAGGKLRCVLFNDSKDHLPPIQSVGDVIIMHRLVIREFRGDKQGCGYANTGFTAAVFPGHVNAPLVPRSAPFTCSYGESELTRITELRSWFHSPSCPVEREPSDGSGQTQTPFSTTLENGTVQSSLGPERIGHVTSGNQSVHIRRLWSLLPDEFVTIQGQLVSVYRHPSEDRCVILYLWDGPPSRSTSSPDSLAHFFGLSKEHLSYLARSASHNPELVAITAHGLSDGFASTADSIDWSVPVLIYDEHASSPPVTELVPGDLVQINNVHVIRCRPPDCPIPGCLRVIVHGGGHKFARGVRRIGTMHMLRDYMSSIASGQTLPEALRSVNEFNLLTQLRDGLLRRPCALHIPGCLTVPLTISQMSNLPHRFHQIAAEKFDLPFPTFRNPLDHTPIPCDSWITLSDCPESVAKHRTTACVRLMARVQDVFPQNVDDLRDSVLLTCSQCQSAVRVSCLLDPNEEVCRCELPGKAQFTGNLSEAFSLIAFIFLTLEDATGSLVLVASAKAALDLLQLPDISWVRVVEELIVQSTCVRATTSTEPSDAEKVLRRIRSLKHQWVNVLVRESWRTEWDLGVPASLDELQLKFELMSRAGPATNSD